MVSNLVFPPGGSPAQPGRGDALRKTTSVARQAVVGIGEFCAEVFVGGRHDPCLVMALEARCVTGVTRRRSIGIVATSTLAGSEVGAMTALIVASETIGFAPTRMARFQSRCSVIAAAGEGQERQGDSESNEEQ